jgi:hypothetical protein
VNRRLIGLVTILASLPVLTVVGTSPAAAGLSTSASTTDPKNDGESRRFDIFSIRGAKVGENLVLTMKVRDLTKANTRVVQTADGWWHQKAIFGFYIRINGQKNYAYTLTTGFDGQSRLTEENSEAMTVDCLPTDNGVDNGTYTTYNYVQNKVQLTVPLACIPQVNTIAISAYSNDAWGKKFGGQIDMVTVQRRDSRALRYTSWFSVR